jgi:AI-2 transport protein TqsA
MGRRTAVVLETVRAVARRVRRFLLIRTVLGVISGAAISAWLWLMSIDFAPFLGCSSCFNYLPNLGPIIAAIPPTLLAFVHFGAHVWQPT